MKSIPLIGRVLFSLIFIISAVGHFSPAPIAMASAAGVPLAHIVVPFSGIMELVGAMLIILGYRGRFGALLIAAFLVPVTLMMHQFWAAPTAMEAMMHQAMFMKNLSLFGAALIIAYLGTGPYSLDNRSAEPSLA